MLRSFPHITIHWCQSPVADFRDITPRRRRWRSPFSVDEKHIQFAIVVHRTHAAKRTTTKRVDRFDLLLLTTLNTIGWHYLCPFAIQPERIAPVFRFDWNLFLAWWAAHKQRYVICTICSICHDFMSVSRLWHSFSFECSPIEMEYMLSITSTLAECTRAFHSSLTKWNTENENAWFAAGTFITHVYASSLVCARWVRSWCSNADV